mmetsp:Transcript_75717/g.149655  ORF Transcript_75717/g.149655 Transcript_75717/m.149655 type:complete len:162 (+) Transcript_75717:50-535(+)
MSIIGRFRMIVPAATAKPSPSIGQALGPLGINMMTFCKEFNARTAKVRPEVPIQVTLVPRSDRTYKFMMRTPQVKWFLLRNARVPNGSALGLDPPFVGVPLRTMCMSIMHTARAMGIKVSRELLPEFSKRNDQPVETLEELRKQLRLQNKAGRKGGKGAKK